MYNAPLFFSSYGIFMVALFLFDGQCGAMLKKTGVINGMGLSQHLPDAEKIFQQVSEKLIVLKGKKIRVTIIGIDGNTIKVLGAESVVKSKKGKAFIIEGFKETERNMTIEIPSGMDIIVEGGDVSMTMHNMKGNLDLRGGMIHCQGDGAFQRVKIMAGHLSGYLSTVKRGVFVQCGKSQDMKITYDIQPSFSQPEHPGLHLHYPHMTKIQAAEGSMTLYYPEKCVVSSLKQGRIETSLKPYPPKTRCDAKISLLSPSQGFVLYIKPVDNN